MAAADVWARFRLWRRARPFWGGLLLILSAFVLFFSANLTLADIKVHFGMEGYLSYVLPAIMLLCGVLVWVTPGQRLFYAIIGLLTALYSLIGLNLGGFGGGMLLGIAGGALVFAWTPTPTPTPTPTAPAEPAPRADDAGTSILEPPPFAEPAAPPEPGDARGTPRKLLAITLVPLAVSAAVLVAGHSPARAEDECPKDVPATAEKTPTKKPAKNDDVPCLGPRVQNKKATAGDVPSVSIQPGIMEGDKLTMYESTYDGVTEIRTPDGPKRVLKFSMDKSVTTPFSLTIGERGGRTTLITSGELTTTGDVRFYTSKFEGKLFGLIPVTFTPDQPPPLTLPVLVFTDIRIELAFVRCDELTAKTFKLTELA